MISIKFLPDYSKLRYVNYPKGRVNFRKFMLGDKEIRRHIFFFSVSLLLLKHIDRSNKVVSRINPWVKRPERWVKLNLIRVTPNHLTYSTKNYRLELENFLFIILFLSGLHPRSASPTLF